MTARDLNQLIDDQERGKESGEQTQRPLQEGLKINSVLGLQLLLDLVTRLLAPGRPARHKP